MRRLALALLYGGTVGIVFGLSKFHARYVGHYVFHTSDRLPWTIAFAAVLCLCAYSSGLPDVASSRRGGGPAVAAAVAGGAIISVVQVLDGSILLPRLVVVAGSLACVPWFMCCAAVAAYGKKRDEGRDRVVLVAGLREYEDLESEISVDTERGATLIASMSVHEARGEASHAKPLVELVIAKRATVLVLGRAAGADPAIVHQAAILHESGIRVRTLALFYEEWLGKLPLSELERMSLMFDVGEVHRTAYARLKRVSDVVGSLVGCAILLPVIAVVALVNLFANRGPLFFQQDRVGLGSRSFRIIKFRTMVPGGDPARWADEHDGRITGWGRLLRRSHVDELPQVINVLRGEQSLVGPRPEQPQYVAQLRETIPFYDLRHLGRPGLTGWAQVKFRYASSELDAMQKLQYDFYYLRHQSLAMDMRIIGRTLRSVMGRKGR